MQQEKKRVTYKGVPIGLSADFSKETIEAERSWKEVFNCERHGLTSKITLSSKDIV